MGQAPLAEGLIGDGACPACGSPKRNAAGLINFCSSCGHRWLNRSDSDHRAGEATYTHDYAGYRPDPAYRTAVAGFFQAELVGRVPPPGRLLDVGCGAGELMIVAKGLGYEAEGIDISPASAEVCAGRGLNARAADFLSYDFQDRHDLITMWDVIAHLRNPAAFLDRARSSLTNEGALFIKTPGVGDLSVGMANRWPRLAGTLLGAPSHCQFFDRDSLDALFRRTGFEPQWLNGGRARSGETGGSIKRRIARQARRAVNLLSGDANLYVLARPARCLMASGLEPRA
jgi:SAM-dependent methyltransferase